ncbi:MAG: MBL fold metallo-hydrolase [Chloroflexota bacterium]
MPEAPAGPPRAEPRPAATVVLLRPGPGGPEVLLTQRPATMAFAGDMHVFPGGATDAGDASDAVVARSVLTPDAAAAAWGGGLAPREALAACAAALRELFEEAGVLLAERRAGGAVPRDTLARTRLALLDGSASLASIAEEFDLTLRTDLLAPLSRWVTPPFVPRRFDVRFFAAELPAGAEVSFVGDEVAAHRWITPRAAIAAMAAGEIGLWVPTSATLQQLAWVRGFDDVRERLPPAPAASLRVVEEGADVVRVVLPGAGAVPGQTVNAYVVGRRDLVVVDPGDPSEEAVEAIASIAAARGGRLVGIVLTSAEPDRSAGAEAVAGGTDLPVFAGPGAGSALPFDVVELGDGALVPRCDIELRVLAVPGRGTERLALLVGDQVLAGDLVGPRPSRAITGPVDEDELRRSFERVRAVAPRRVLPAHGEPLDGGSVG